MGDRTPAPSCQGYRTKLYQGLLSALMERSYEGLLLSTGWCPVSCERANRLHVSESSWNLEFGCPYSLKLGSGHAEFIQALGAGLGPWPVGMAGWEPSVGEDKARAGGVGAGQSLGNPEQEQRSSLQGPQLLCSPASYVFHGKLSAVHWLTRNY